MLTAMKLTGNINEIASYHSREENYYFSQKDDVEEILKGANIKFQGQYPLDYVRVHGKLCDYIGFNQGEKISEEVFANLLNGLDKHGKKISRKHKIHGIDLTFSAPKTVSIAGLVLDKNPEIIRAHDEAVLETLKEIEKYHSVARPTSRTQWYTENMVYVTVRDGFSREHDPHLHTHAVVMNMTKYKDKVMGLWTREILNSDFNKTWGIFYRNNLAVRLNQLGYNVSYTKCGEWRLDKISYDLEMEFSTRRKQILQAEKEGCIDMDAWRKTRKIKDPNKNKEKIINSWLERVGLYEINTEEQNRKEVILKRQEWIDQAVWSIEALQEKAGLRSNLNEAEKWQLALRRATEKSATVSKQLLISEYLSECMREKWEKLSFEDIEEKLDRQVKLGNIITVENNRYTSWEMVKTDREYMKYAGRTVDEIAKLQLPEAQKIIQDIHKININAGKRVLSNYQSSAVEKILTSNTMLTIIQGDAGSGKTTALKMAGDIFKSHNYNVIGLSVQGVAARNLEEETGIKTSTLSSFLIQEEKDEKDIGKQVENKKRVIIFDEASMLDSRNAVKLFKIAEKNKDKIVLVGDRNQLESISAGRVFDRLVNDAEKASDLINLNENFRQKDENLRKAVEFARQGYMKDSLNILDDRGDIEEIEKRDQRLDKVASHYDKDTLIITGTVNSRDELNKKIRENLINNKELYDKKSQDYEIVRLDKEGIEEKTEIRLTKNDIITFCKNEYKELDIRNGERGKVLETEKDNIKVELADGRKISIDLKKYKNIDYGYAITTFKAQGQTFNKVVVEADTNVPSLNDMRNQYVNITRARESIKIFTDDKEYLYHLADIKTHARDTLDKIDISLYDVEKAEQNMKNIQLQISIKENSQIVTKEITREKYLDRGLEN